MEQLTTRARFGPSRFEAGLAALLVVLVVIGGGVGRDARAGAQASGGITGGGAIAGAVVEIPQGGELGLANSVYARNEGSSPIVVEFHAESPAGILVLPDSPRTEIPPGELARTFFAVALDPSLAAGEYSVGVGFSRAEDATGSGMSFVPAFTLRFTVRVVGAAGTINVVARDATGAGPAFGLITISRTGEARDVTMARTEGSELTGRFAPGAYDVRFRLGGRVLASRTVELGADQVQDVTLDVHTIAFGAVALKQNRIDDELRTIELESTLRNDFGPLAHATTQLVVERDGAVVDTIDIQDYTPLRAGEHPVAVRYVPDDGWAGGSYRFVLQLTGGDVTVRAAQQPVLEVQGAGGFGRALDLFAERPWLAPLLIALVGIGLGWFLGRRRRRGAATARTAPTPAPARARARAAAVPAAPPTVAPVADLPDPAREPTPVPAAVPPAARTARRTRPGARRRARRSEPVTVAAAPDVARPAPPVGDGSPGVAPFLPRGAGATDASAPVPPPPPAPVPPPPVPPHPTAAPAPPRPTAPRWNEDGPATP